MGKPSDDDPSADWVDDRRTEVTTGGVLAIPTTDDEVTKPHGVAKMLEEAYARGRREVAGERATWFAEGQEDALAALRAEFHAGGWADGVVEHVVASVRKRFTKL